MESTKFKRFVKEAVHEVLNELQFRDCSWCGKRMGVNNPDLIGPEITTNGICPDCLKKWTDNVNAEKAQKNQQTSPPNPTGLA